MTREIWTVRRNMEDAFRAPAEKLKIDPMILCMAARRSHASTFEELQTYLYGGPEKFHDPFLMKGMREAVILLQEKIMAGKKIRIIGDYDIDGVMSACLLLRGLRSLGANVDAVIPHRIRDGYGLNERLIREAAGDGVDTVLTCDNGIAAADQIRMAREQFYMTVIVTDHHEIPFKQDGKGSKEYLLPPADVILDPRQEDCTYPCKALCGGGVAFKLMTALYGQMKREILPELLEYAGFATIGDIVPLLGENRLLAREGLRRMRTSRNMGLRALMEATGTLPARLEEYSIGFVLGPCINAAGRLASADLALQLLLTEDPDQASQLAGKLGSLNEKRKEMTEEAVETAVFLADQAEKRGERILVLFLPDCHESVAGIVAGRIKEAYHKPCFILTRTAEGLKGSGRSIDSYHMYEQMTACRELFTRYGGHAKAAGLSMPEANLQPFREKINALCRLTDEDLIPHVSVDFQLPFHRIDFNMTEQLQILKPYGEGNEAPRFAVRAELVAHRILGERRNTLRMTLRDSAGTCMEAVYFGDPQAFLAEAGENGFLDLIFVPEINRYQGREKLQLKIRNFRRSAV